MNCVKCTKGEELLVLCFGVRSLFLVPALKVTVFRSWFYVAE